MDKDTVPKIHLFICTNGPDKKGKCGYLGSEDLRREIKERVKELPQGRDLVRVNASGCLGQCHRGISCVLYPKGEWFFEHSKKDADFFVDLIKKEIKT